MPSDRSVRMTRRAISPRFATSTVSKRGEADAGVSNIGFVSMEVIRSHPEQAEAGVGQGRACHDVEGEAEPIPCVGGIDDAVVPQPCGGVVGLALGLVLVADGLLESAALIGGPSLTTGRELILLHGR